MFCHQHDLQYGTVSFICIFISHSLSWDTTHTIHHVTDKNSVFLNHSVYNKWMTTVILHVLWKLAFSIFIFNTHMYMCYQLRIFKRPNLIQHRQNLQHLPLTDRVKTSFHLSYLPIFTMDTSLNNQVQHSVRKIYKHGTRHMENWDWIIVSYLLLAAPSKQIVLSTNECLQDYYKSVDIWCTCSTNHLNWFWVFHYSQWIWESNYLQKQLDLWHSL